MASTKWTKQEKEQTSHLTAEKNRTYKTKITKNKVDRDSGTHAHQVTSVSDVSSSSLTECFTSSPVDLELNRDFNGEDYEYEDEAKLVIFPDHFEIPLPNIEELPALVSESVLHGLPVCFHACRWEGALSSSPVTEQPESIHSFSFKWEFHGHKC